MIGGRRKASRKRGAISINNTSVTRRETVIHESHSHPKSKRYDEDKCGADDGHRQAMRRRTVQ